MTWSVDGHPGLGDFEDGNAAVAAAWTVTPPGGKRPVVHENADLFENPEWMLRESERSRSSGIGGRRTGQLIIDEVQHVLHREHGVEVEIKASVTGNLDELFREVSESRDGLSDRLQDDLLAQAEPLFGERLTVVDWAAQIVVDPPDLTGLSSPVLEALHRSERLVVRATLRKRSEK